MPLSSAPNDLFSGRQPATASGEWFAPGSSPHEASTGTAMIVGAGAAGLATALGLARIGMDVHVRIPERNIFFYIYL